MSWSLVGDKGISLSTALPSSKYIHVKLLFFREPPKSTPAIVDGCLDILKPQQSYRLARAQLISRLIKGRLKPAGKEETRNIFPDCVVFATLNLGTWELGI
jgi:hypothetical protein